MATPTEIKDRIVTLMGQVSGVTTSLDDYLSKDDPFTDAQLPAAITRLLHVPTTRTWLSADTYLERHAFQIILHVAVCSNVDVLAPNTTEMELCEPFKHSVPYFFAQRAHQRLGGTGLADMVYDTELVSDGGIIRIERSGLSWWGFAFTLPVIEEVTI